MKKLLIISLMLASVTCNKSNFSVIRHTYRIKYYQDTTLFTNSAYACPEDRSWEADTTLYFNHEPEAVQQIYQEISIGDAVFYKPIQWNSQYIRLYFIYKEKIN
jgi:hypothetical protein